MTERGGGGGGGGEKSVMGGKKGERTERGYIYSTKERVHKPLYIHVYNVKCIYILYILYIYLACTCTVPLSSYPQYENSILEELSPTHTQTHTNTHTHTHTDTHIHMCTCVYTCTCIYTRKCQNANAYMHSNMRHIIHYMFCTFPNLSRETSTNFL